MAVCRVEKNKNYTTMSNYHLRDKNLSNKACGLLSKMPGTKMCSSSAAPAPARPASGSNRT